MGQMQKSRDALLQRKVKEQVKEIALCCVRLYSADVTWYRERRDDILYSSGGGYETYTKSQTTEGVTVHEEYRVYLPHGSGVGRPTEEKGAALVALEEHPRTRRMHAVAQAKHEIGEDIVSEDLRLRMMCAILTNCESGRKNPFNYLNVPEISRRDFYRRKERFLLSIAEKLKLF